MEKLIAFDTETGGIGTQYSLLEVYFEVLDGNTLEVLDSLELKLKPDDGNYIVTGKAMEVNGINLAEHDKIAVTYSEAKGTLRTFLNKNSDGGKIKLIPLGHNIAGDIDQVATHILGSKEKWNQYTSYRVQDTGVIAQYLRRKGVIPMDVLGSLGSLAKHYNVTAVEGLHTSKGDTKRTVAVFKSM